MPVRDAEDLQGRVGPFLTYVERVRPDGVVARWESRDHRKHLPGALTAGSTWWAPRARGWWIAVLFAVGSLLFALGAVPGYASAVGARWDALTFFIGSLFFTSAGFLTYREAVTPAAYPGLRRPAFLRVPAPPDRLVGHRGAAGRDPLVQHQHRQRAPGRPVRPGRAPAHMAARCDRLGRLPGRQRAGLVRSLPRLGRLASPLLVLVDHPGQPGRFHRLRRIRRGRLHQPGHRPDTQRRTVQPGHPDRRGVLPHRRDLLLPERTEDSEAPVTTPAPAPPDQPPIGLPRAPARRDTPALASGLAGGKDGPV